MNPDRIILVYNADHGLFNAVTGWSHKLLSPETYQCSLCRITFGMSGMLISWKNFLQMLPFPAVFFHRDEFRPRYPQYEAIHLPLILAEKDGGIEILLRADEIGNAGGVASLIGLIQLKLEQWAHVQAAKAQPVSPAVRRHRANCH